MSGDRPSERRDSTLPAAGFGSDTVIGPAARLILMDCFETLVQFGPGGYRARRGVERFLSTFVVDRGIPAVVVSDAAEAAIFAALREAGVLMHIAAIYDARDVEPLGEGRLRKRLDLPLKLFAVEPHQAVFIGDSRLDAEAAHHHRVPFIRVPRSEDRAFSFERLLDGPSSYRSGEFAVHLKNEYRLP